MIAEATYILLLLRLLRGRQRAVRHGQQRTARPLHGAVLGTASFSPPARQGALLGHPFEVERATRRDGKPGPGVVVLPVLMIVSVVGGVVDAVGAACGRWRRECTGCRICCRRSRPRCIGLCRRRGHGRLYHGEVLRWWRRQCLGRAILAASWRRGRGQGVCCRSGLRAGSRDMKSAGERRPCLGVQRFCLAGQVMMSE